MPSPATPEARAERFVTMSFNEHMGVTFAPREPGRAEVTLVPGAEHVQAEGVVHGGVLATLGDIAGAYAIYPEVDGGRTITSIEFKVNFLRAATADRGPIVARATALKIGKSVATSDVELVQGDELVAKGLFTYLVFEPSDLGSKATAC